MARNPEFNQYTYVSRKVHDNMIDRLKLKISRLKEDYRNDLAAVLRRIALVETTLDLNKKHGCQDPNCKFCDYDNEMELNGSEELE